MQLTILRPDDWHLHLRDGTSLAAVLAHTAQRFGRAVVMPNLKPPITTVESASAYRDRILAARPAGSHFQPLMTLYLTNQMDRAEIRRAKSSGFVHAVKYYPAGATTNSEAGVTGLERAYDALEALEEYDLPLLVHGESTDPTVDVFDREAVFIERVLGPVRDRFPRLRIVFEHVTTRDAVKFVQSAGPLMAATITPQHLLLNRNALFQGGIRPHNYCLPVLKRETHRLALLDAATSGSPQFFLGTDSAPHARHTKETTCGCAGIYSAHAGIELYVEAFEAAGALDKLEGFSSFYGADFYRLPRNADTITLVREAWSPPSSYSFGEHELVPFRAGESIAWTLRDEPPRPR
jgi:dihydroorotase